MLRHSPFTEDLHQHPFPLTEGNLKIFTFMENGKQARCSVLVLQRADFEAAPPGSVPWKTRSSIAASNPQSFERSAVFVHIGDLS